MSVARKILSNTVFQVGGKVVGALISVAIVKLITNFLSLEGYGQYVTVYEFLAFFGIAADLGLFTIAVREMSKERHRMDFIVSNVVGMRVLLALASMLLAVIVAFSIPGYEGTYIPVGVAVASFSVFFGIMNGTVSSVLQVHLKMQYPTFALVIGKAASLAYMIYVVYYGFTTPSAESFYQLLWAGVIGNALMFLFTLYFSTRYAKIRFLFDRAYWRETLWKALPYGLALILNMIYFRIDSLLLQFLRGSAEVGVYGVPMRILDILSVVPVYFMNSVLPVLTTSLKDNMERARRVVQHSFDFLMAAAAPMVVGAQIVAYPLIFVVSSPEFLSRLDEGFIGSDIALQILVVAMAFAFISSVFTFTLIAIGYQGKLLYISLAGALFNVVANLFVIPTWGVPGAALTSVISEFIILFSAFFMFRRHFKIQLNLKPTLKIFLSAAVMGGVLWFTRDPLYAVMQNWNILVLMPLSFVVYGGMLWGTGVVNKERLKVLKRSV